MPDLETIKSYAVALGFSVDNAQARNFDLALRDVSNSVERHTGGILKQFLGWQIGITSAFVGVSGAVVGLADKVAQSDLNFKLFGMQMYMNESSAKRLKIAMDALGQPLENIIWNPELHARFLQLEQDQNTLQKNLGPNFENNMKGIRDITAQFTRLKVVGEYLSMQFVDSVFKKLGSSIPDAQDKLEGFVDWAINNVPQIADKLADNVLPILKDTWDILGEMTEVAKEFGVVLVNAVGLLSGNKDLEGTELSFEKVSGAIQEVIKWLKTFVDGMLAAEKATAHFTAGAEALKEGDKKGAKKEFAAGAAATTPGGAFLTGGITGAGIGTVMGGPIGTVTGAVIGATVGFAAAKIRDAYSSDRFDTDVVIKAAKNRGVNPAMVLGVGEQESGLRQYVNGKVIASDKGALGIMQLTPPTAKLMNVDPMDSMQNLDGGIKLLGILMKKYQNDQVKALEAYNWGEGNLDRVLRGDKDKTGKLYTVPADVHKYAEMVMNRESQYESLVKDYSPNAQFVAKSLDKDYSPSAQVAATPTQQTVTNSVVVGDVNVHMHDGATSAETARQTANEVLDQIKAATQRQNQINQAQLSAQMAY